VAKKQAIENQLMMNDDKIRIPLAKTSKLLSSAFFPFRFISWNIQGLFGIMIDGNLLKTKSGNPAAAPENSSGHPRSFP
jgi:chaperone required for assembly of F1-ATPase